jgi:ribosomal protein L37AE/L43A
LAKCEHGVYIAAADDVAWFCQACNPWLMTEGIPFEQRDLHLPDTNHPRALNNTRMRATRSVTQCPACRSQIFEQLEGRQRRCGECGAEYRGPKVVAVVTPEPEEVEAWME